MVVAVEDQGGGLPEALGFRQGVLEIQGIVHDPEVALRPVELQGRVAELDAELLGGALEDRPLGQVVVAVDRVKGGVEPGQHLQGLGLGDVSRVHDPVHPSVVQDLDDPGDVGQVVVGVAHDADSHGRATVAQGYAPGPRTQETPAMPYETLLTNLEDGILTLTLNRPDKLNAFTETMMNDYLEVLDEVDANDDIRVVIVTGAGRGFCAGADLSAGGSTFDSGGGADGSPQPVPRDGGGRVTLRLFECKKPLIAAINGPAVGVGITQTLPMDIRLASDQAKMGFVFSRRGLVPEACSSWFLPRIVGISKAMEWVATGRVFPAAEAHAAGLVSELLPADDLLPRARALATEIAENTSPVSVALSRQMLWKMLGADHPMEAHRIDSRGIHFMGSSPDAREGVQSFLEKRPPAFEMKVSKDLPDYFPWWKDRAFDAE